MGQGWDWDLWVLCVMQKCSHLSETEMDQDPLFPIVLVTFPVLPPFPVPCSVSKPLEIKACVLHHIPIACLVLTLS